jgi:tetratricopeptide (TPR) repeat protein
MNVSRRGSLLLVAAIACSSLTALAQQPQKPAAPTAAQLEQRVKELESRLDSADLRAKAAALDTEYVQRIQKQYESYYEKAFNTQIIIVTIIGLIVAVVGKFGVDHIVQSKLMEASATLREEFTQKLAAKMMRLDNDFSRKSTNSYYLLLGVAMVAAGEHSDALEIFRETLAFYKRDKSLGLVLRTTGPSLRRSVGALLNNIFFAIQRIDPTHFEENAKNELAKELYDDLEEELALVALYTPELAPIIRERKQAATSPALSSGLPVKPTPSK